MFRIFMTFCTPTPPLPSTGFFFLFSRSQARTGVETGRPSPALEEDQEGSRQQGGGQPVGQLSSISAQLSGSETPSGASCRPKPGPMLFLESPQTLMPWPACSQPCPGHRRTHLSGLKEG